MTEERKPPRRYPLSSDDVVFVEEDPPATDRVPLPLPSPKKLPDERPPPPRWDLHKGRGPSYVEIAAQLTELVGMQAAILATQRKMALQQDGLIGVVNQRFSVFHEELSMLRQLVTGDHAPRLGKVESDVQKLTPQQKAKAATLIAAKFGAGGTGILFFGGLALRALAKLYPQYGELIEGALGLVGL